MVLKYVENDSAYAELLNGCLDEIQKYSLDKVIEEYNLYVTVVDLNRSADLRDTFEEAASLWLTQGSSWFWEIALNGASANIQPLRLSQPCRR